MQRHRIPLARIVVVENGANTDMFHPDLPREHGDVLRVGFSGSFNAWHGVEELLRSIPRVLEEFRNVRFVFLGDGPLKKRAVRLAGELGLGGAVEFADRVPYEDAPKNVASFDVGVILKKRDIPGSPLKLWEYMAAGKPVVASDSDDFSVLREQNAGVLTDPEKPEEVAHAILSLLRDEALRKEMGANGSRYVSENRSWKHVADEVAEVLRQTQ
jgi:glycosyltransferase involved in cell wall biosynthesis